MNVVPLEIWDAVVDGRSLFARRADPDFFDALAGVAAERRRAHAFADVALVGGGVDVPRAHAAFAARGLPLAVVSADPFYVVRGARARADVVVDVGQTSIKVVGPRGYERHPRAEDRDRAAFARAIGAAIRTASDAADARVLLALPCAVEGGRLGESSYPTAGDVAPLLAAIGHAGPIDVVNDAVLAAEVVGADRRRLVLTVGHGVGAALVAPEEHP